MGIQLLKKSLTSIEVKPNWELAPFMRDASLYVLKKGKRLTLAIRGIRNQDTNVAIIT